LILPSTKAAMKGRILPYNKMRYYVGAFVIIFFATVTTFGYLLLEEKGVFEKRYKFNFHAKSAASMSVGMPIKFSGFAIGEIDSISLLDDGSVNVNFSVNAKNKKWISSGSSLTLTKPLIGAAYIKLRAHRGNKELPAGATLPLSVADDINDIITKLQPTIKQITRIIANIDILTAELTRPDSHFNNTIANFDILSTKLLKSDSLLTSVTGDKNATDAAINSIKTLDIILNDIAKTTADMNATLIAPTSKTIIELRDILKDLHQKLHKLDPLVTSIGESNDTIETIKEQLEVGIVKSNQLLDKVDALLLDKKSQKVKLP